MTSFYQYSYDDLCSLFSEQSLPPSNPRLLFNWYYKKKRQDECQIFGLSQKAKEYIKASFNFSLPTLDTIKLSQDKTVKFLFKMQDGHRVETVLIPFQNKYTVCLSSQVGCAMNCAFCYTGKQGFTRHLKTEEIVGQFMQVQHWLTENRPDDNRILNIVYMGQGEPLHNFDAVKKSAEIFISQYGLSLAGHKITVSTSGYLPGLQRWKKEMPDVNVALSLHATDTEKRNKLIPINKRFPLEDVMKWIDQIPVGKKRFATFEYLLLKGFNDSADDAQALGALLKDKKALINLIPFNPIPGSEFSRPTDEKVQQFKSILDGYQIPTMIRTTKGDEILAACGQLNTAVSLA